MIKKSMTLIYLVALFFIGTRCSTLTLNLPGATIESSETVGSSRKELGPSLEPAREVEFVDSAQSRPPDLNNARATGATHNLLHQSSFGLGERFELGGQVGIDLSSDIQAMFFLTGKFQFLGPSKKEAKKGDVSASVYGRLGHTRVDGSGDQQATFGPGGFPWSADVRATFGMIGLSYGYRVTDSFLYYLGGSYQHTTTEVTVDQSPAEDNSDPGGHYKRERKGRSYSYGMGGQWRLGKVIHLHAKLMMFHFYFDGIENREALYGGGGVHFYF